MIDPVSCPIEFQIDCKLYQVECTRCSASLRDITLSSSKGLRYKSLTNRPRSDHPVMIRVKELGRLSRAEVRKSKTQSQGYKNNYRGRKKEREVINRLSRDMDIKQTAGSGAIYGDGDALLDKFYTVEHKYRSGTNNTLGPTQEEWRKLDSNGIFLTTSKRDGLQQTIVTLSMETLIDVINTLGERAD